MSVSFYGFDHRVVEQGPAGPFPKMVKVPFEDPRHLNLANGNARVILELLRLPKNDADGDLWGEVSVPDARRALIRARATFARVAPVLVREPVQQMGVGRREDGLAEMRTRSFVGGLDQPGMLDRLERFGVVVELLASMGATHIAWG